MTKKHLLMLPGMMCDERLFTHQIEALSEQYEIRVPCISKHQSIKEIAANVLKHAPEKFSVLGLSMGGIVAMEVVSQAHDRVLSLLLLDTNPVAELPAVKAGREPQIEKVKNGKLHEVMRDEMKPRYLFEGVRKPEILDLCIDMALELGPEAFVNQSIALKNRQDYCCALQAVEVPSLVLCGQYDSLCSPQRHQMMHELLPNSELFLVPKAGHLPTLEQAGVTTSAVQKFLDNAFGSGV